MTATRTTDPQSQHMIALRHANEVRLRRACVLRAVENGDMTLADALAEPVIQDVTILAVLERCSFGRLRIRRDDSHRLGPRRCTQAARRLLAAYAIAPTVKVAALTDARRNRLIAAYESCVASP